MQSIQVVGSLTFALRSLHVIEITVDRQRKKNPTTIKKKPK